MIPSSPKFDREIKKINRGRTKVRIIHGVNDKNKIYSIKGTEMTPTLSAKSDQMVNKPKYNFIRLSKNYMRTDGKQIIAPSSPNYEQLEYCGCTINQKSDSQNNLNATYKINLSLSGEPTSIFGFILTFDIFNNTYATKLKVNINDPSGTLLATRNFSNNSTKFVFDEEFINVGSIEIVISQINKPNALLRIMNFHLGTQIVYDSSNLMSNAFSYKRKIDLLSNELSFSELTFNVNNLDKSYNPFNLTGIYKRFDKNQPVKFLMSLQFEDGTEEELEVANLYTQEFDFKDNYYSVKCVDLLSLANQENYFTSNIDTYNRITFNYDDVISEMVSNSDKLLEMNDFIFSSGVKNTRNTTNIPTIPFNQVFQLIANRCQDIVYTDRQGYIRFKDAWLPKVTFEDNGHMEYSSVANAYNTNQLPEYTYIQLLQDYMITEPNKWQVVRPEDTEYLGYVGNQISKQDGTFDVNPFITINFSLPTQVESLYFVFDHLMKEYPIELTVNYYSGDRLVHTLDLTDNSAYEISQDVSLNNVTKYTIEIKKWSHANRRAVINRIGLGVVDDYYLDFHQMLQKPNVEMLGYVKGINCNITKFDKDGSQMEEIGEQTFYGDRNRGSYHIFYCDEAHDGYTVEKVSGSGTITNIDGIYSNMCMFETQGNTDSMVVKLKGFKQKANDFNYLTNYDVRGETFNVDNPLCSDKLTAAKLSEWYYDYIRKGQKLTIEYRGDCRLEPFDFIYIQSQYQRKLPVVITGIELTYNNGLKGKLEVLNI